MFRARIQLGRHHSSIAETTLLSFLSFALKQLQIRFGFRHTGEVASTVSIQADAMDQAVPLCRCKTFGRTPPRCETFDTTTVEWSTQRSFGTFVLRAIEAFGVIRPTKRPQCSGDRLARLERLLELAALAQVAF